jgi:hypothetical protein
MGGALGLRKLIANQMLVSLTVPLTSLFGQVPYDVNAFVTASWQRLDSATGVVTGAGVQRTLAPYKKILDVV